MPIEKIVANGITFDTLPKVSGVYSSKKIADILNYVKTDLTLYGNLFASENTYSSHVPDNCFYDSVIDKVVLFYNVSDAHLTGVGDLKMRTIDPHTFVVSASSTIATYTDRRTITMATCRQSNGNWLVVAKLSFTDSSDHIDKYIMYKSINQGQSWTTWDLSVTGAGTYEYNVSGLIELSTGRLIACCGFTTYKTCVIYSDDGGLTWARSNDIAKHISYPNSLPEATFFEFPSGKILMYARASMNASNYANVEPVLISYSTNQGVTWSQQVASTSITDCTADYAPTIIDHPLEGIVELVWGSRHFYSEETGRIYQALATYEEFENDTIPTPIIIGHDIATTNHYDFGYFGSCTDAYGGVWVFWYDLNTTVSGECNVKYAYGNRTSKALKQDIKDIKNGYLKQANSITVTGNKTLNQTDVNTIQKCTASANITVPQGNILPIGTEIAFVQYGSTDTVQIVAGSGVTINSYLGYTKLNGQYSTAAIIKIDTDEWVLSGTLKV